MGTVERAKGSHLRMFDILGKLQRDGCFPGPRLKTGLLPEYYRNAIVNSFLQYRECRGILQQRPDRDEKRLRVVGRAMLDLEPRSDYSARFLRGALQADFVMQVTKESMLKRSRNTLVLTLAGILRRLTNLKDPLGEPLPLLMDSGSPRSKKKLWTIEALEKRIERTGGMRAADLAAVVPLSIEAALHPFLPQFKAFGSHNRIDFAILADQHREAQWDGVKAMEVQQDCAVKYLPRHRWLLFSRSESPLGIPTLLTWDAIILGWDCVLTARNPLA